jgi:hypothetical protein
MSWDQPDSIHRTALAFLGTAADTPEEADEMIRRLVLQVHVGRRALSSRSQIAAIGTIVNSGRRAFVGGVHVVVEDDEELSHGWSAGQRLCSFIETLGGVIVKSLQSDFPTIVIGEAAEPVGQITLYPTWHGWSAGVVTQAAERLDDHGIEVAAVAAAALGISEAFQFVTGPPGPGRRQVGVSLWKSGENWRSTETFGPKVAYLPSKLWLLGLGHLGQGYAWSLGWLGYEDPSATTIGLVDDDIVERGNDATGMLLRESDEGSRKTRVVARALEQRGFRTLVVDRRFDNHFAPQQGEPTIALAGFDKPEPRQLLGNRFARVVDGGLGVGTKEFLSISIHTFPSTLDPQTEFVPRQSSPRELSPAIEAAIERLVSDGVAPGTARCGMIAVAGIAVAAAFVGTFAGALVVADLLRTLHGGKPYCLIRCDLRSPSDLRSAENLAPGAAVNAGFVKALDTEDSDLF